MPNTPVIPQTNTSRSVTYPRSHVGVILPILLAVFLFSATLYFWKLGTHAVTDTDEATHAMVTREMRERNDPLTLHFLGKEYFRKPPFAFWLRAGAEGIFGETEFALRFFSAVSGVATSVLLAWWAWGLTRKRLPALIGGLLFPLLPVTHIHTFRNGDTDGVLLGLLTVTAYLFWKSLTRPRLLIVAGAILGLAFLTKSVAVLPLLIACGLTLLILRQWPYPVRTVLGAAGALLVVALPWHIHQFLTHRQAFWDDYVGYHILQRTAERIEASSKTRGLLWYFKAGEKGMFPWSWLVIPTLALFVVRIRATLRSHTGELLLFLWGLTTFVLYSLAATKLDWYIAPAYIPWTMLLAVAIATAFDSFPRWARWLFALTFVVFLARSIYLARIGVTAAFPFASFGLRTAVAALAVLGVVCALVSFFFARRVRLPLSRVLAPCALIVFLISGWQTWIEYEGTLAGESPFRVFRQTIDATAPTENIYLFDLTFYPRPATRWYLVNEVDSPRLIALKEDVNALARVVVDDPKSFVMAKDSWAFAPEIMARLTKVSSFDDLILYQITSP